MVQVGHRPVAVGERQHPCRDAGLGPDPTDERRHAVGREVAPPVVQLLLDLRELLLARGGRTSGIPAEEPRQRGGAGTTSIGGPRDRGQQPVPVGGRLGARARCRHGRSPPGSPAGRARRGPGAPLGWRRPAPRRRRAGAVAAARSPRRGSRRTPAGRGGGWPVSWNTAGIGICEHAVAASWTAEGWARPSGGRDSAGIVVPSRWRMARPSCPARDATGWKPMSVAPNVTPSSSTSVARSTPGRTASWCRGCGSSVSDRCAAWR